jgi:alpha-tubulin suppressor-like RCC1 family protein
MVNTVKFKQITAVFESLPSGSGNIHLFALDENGQVWQWMRGKWGKMKNPTEE